MSAPSVLVQVVGGVCEDVVGGDLIAIRDLDNGDEEFSDGEIDAALKSAAVILAAPDLLAALVAMLDEFEPTALAMADWPAAVHQARAAVAKAAGDAP